MFKFDFDDTVQLTHEKFISLPFDKCSTTGIVINRYVDVDVESSSGTYLYEVKIKVNDFSTSIVECREDEIVSFNEEQ